MAAKRRRYQMAGRGSGWRRIPYLLKLPALRRDFSDATPDMGGKPKQTSISSFSKITSQLERIQGLGWALRRTLALSARRQTVSQPIREKGGFCTHPASL